MEGLAPIANNQVRVCFGYSEQDLRQVQQASHVAPGDAEWRSVLIAGTGNPKQMA